MEYATKMGDTNGDIKGRSGHKKTLAKNSKTWTGSMSTSSSSPEETITAAEMIRQKQQQQHKYLPESKSIANESKNILTIQGSINDIDDEIQRLERELQEDVDDDDDSENSEDETSTSGGGNTKVDENDHYQTDAMILSISQSNQNLIEKLPSHCLPPLTLVSGGSKSSHKKRSRNVDDTNDTLHNHISGTGLKKAVQELIQNYQGRTNTERKPFYCRYCQHQATDYNDFRHHQTETSHLQNVTLHNKASYCKLCSKQFNSPIQLHEHLQSKPHHDRLQYLQSKQQKHRPNAHSQTRFQPPPKHPHARKSYNNTVAK